MKKEEQIIMQDYWWEEALNGLLVEYKRGEKVRGEKEREAIILFIVKIINAETKNTYEK